MATTHSPTIDWTTFFSNRASRMLGELGQIVEMESPSRDAPAIRAISEYFARELNALGASSHAVEDHPNGPNLVSRFDGDGKPVVLLGHLDTVWPTGTLARMPWRVEGGLAYGPGVFDMKAGCLVVLEALRGLAAQGLKIPATVLLTCDEEIGSPSSRGLVETEAAASRAVLVFEPSIPGGLAKTSRSGMADYHIWFKGQAAHAGVDPDKGRSAIVAGAEIVRQLHALNDLANGLSVNTGIFRGGTRHNVVAAEAELSVDVRFRTAEQGHAVDRAITGLPSPVDGVEMRIEGGIDRPPLVPTPAIQELFERAKRAAARAGFTLGQGHVGGVSDGNITAALGVPTLDGLGPDGCGAHADHEQIVVEDLPRRAAMLVHLLLDLTH